MAAHSYPVQCREPNCTGRAAKVIGLPTEEHVYYSCGHHLAIPLLQPLNVSTFPSFTLTTGSTSSSTSKKSKAKPKPKTKTKETEPTVNFDTVILPEAKKREILDAISQVDNHDLIFKKWGFGKVFEKGTAISLLFYGPPGTGKTLMAQAIADKFKYKLKLIDTAQIESSEPGQAERNIKACFGSTAKTVLLFDECDSLISDRNTMGSILGAQVNALLSGLETYKGIAVFTTNRLGILDPAFERRLSLKLAFEMPEAKERKQIWLRMFPKQAPLASNIDWDGISQVEIAGGHIKNVVLKAARMAANSKHKKITEAILLEALSLEVSSMVDFHRSKQPITRHMGGGMAMGKVADRRVEKV